MERSYQTNLAYTLYNSYLFLHMFIIQVSFAKHAVNFLVEMNSLVRQIAEHVDHATVILDWNTILFVIKPLVNVIVRYAET